MVSAFGAAAYHSPSANAAWIVLFDLIYIYVTCYPL